MTSQETARINRVLTLYWIARDYRTGFHLTGIGGILVPRVKGKVIFHNVELPLLV